jgi:peptidoglycan hydrolase-like protein with peptidoglycan-binding domain
VSQVELLFLPSVRRTAAVALSCAALLGVTTTAFAADGASATGGTTAAATAPPKAKKVTTKQIQKALGIKADGVMGPKTRKALKRFQKAHGLKADGVVGPATLQALGLATPKNSTLESTAPLSDDDVAAVMAKIAQCESGGNPTAVSPSGEYRGKYQFSQATWDALGGTGDPAEAEESVQDAIAAKLYAERGAAPWPSCAEA